MHRSTVPIRFCWRIALSTICAVFPLLLDAGPAAQQTLAFDINQVLDLIILPNNLSFHISNIQPGSIGLDTQVATYYMVINTAAARVQIALDQDMPPYTTLSVDGDVPVTRLHGQPGPISAKPRDLLNGIPICNAGPKLLQFTFTATYQATAGAFDRSIIFTVMAP